MKWTKKILFILVVGFCLFYLIQQPEGAAEAVRTVFGALVRAFQALVTFFTSLAAQAGVPGLVEWLDPHVERYLLLSEQEYVVLEVYKHWMASIGAWARLVVAVPVLISSWAFEPPLFWVLFVLALGVAAQALYSIVDEYRDRFVITNQRVFRVHGTFSVQRASVPLGRILDITVKKPLVGRIFNYGHFVFESAAQVQGLSEVRFVRNIDDRDRTLQETMQRAGLRATAPQLGDDGT